nr:sigma-70 family RNA polymerase sigma factor [uncultured Desulfobacter sp.]
MESTYQKYNSLSDGQLIDAIISEDRRAIEFLLINCMGAKFKHMCRIYPHAGVEPEDLTQEIFRKMMNNDWQMLRSFRGSGFNNRRCRLTTYITVIAARWIKKKNDRGMKETSFTGAHLYNKGSNSEPEIEDFQGKHLSRKKELGADLIKLIMELEKSRERVVLIEYKLKERPIKEVASMLKTTENNIYNIAHRAMKNLRPVLVKGGYHE